MKLYRVMKVDPVDGLPRVGVRRNMLGVRPTDPASRDPKRRFDVTAVIGSDPIVPGACEGVSVSITADRFNPTSDEAIWQIADAELSPDFRPVPDNPPHHVLEPTRPMTLDEYQAALAATRHLWARA